MKVRNKILTVITILMIIICVISLSFFFKTYNTNTQHSGNNTEKTKETTAQQTDKKVTEDDIKKVEMELQKYKSANKETEQEIIKSACEYINIRYNSNKSNDEILKEVTPYIAQSYLQQIKISLNQSAGNFINTHNKVINNYCTTDDIYFTSDTYEDGSELYMTACICKVDDTFTRYHQISFALYEDGTYLINNDSTISINYASYELNPKEPTTSKATEATK